MTTLVLWRHGQTDYNLAGRVQGRVDIALNDTGRAQAAAAAPGLAALGPSRVVSSPLERAHGTARELGALTGLPVTIDDGLLERSFGVWEGLDRAAMEKGWPEEFALWRGGGDPVGVGVETRAHAAERVGGALARIADDAPEDATVVVAAHGAAITLGTTHLLGLDPAGWFGLRGLDNCHHATLRRTDRAPGWVLVEWNAGGGDTEPGTPAGFVS